MATTYRLRNLATGEESGECNLEEANAKLSSWAASMLPNCIHFVEYTLCSRNGTTTNQFPLRQTDVKTVNVQLLVQRRPEWMTVEGFLLDAVLTFGSGSPEYILADLLRCSPQPEKLADYIATYRPDLLSALETALRRRRVTWTPHKP